MSLLLSEVGKATRRQRTGAKSRRKAISAPVGGWNTRDALDDMPKDDAVTLENWIPEPGRIAIRKGYASHCDTTDANDVETLIEYHAGANRHLIAAAGTTVYNASAATPSTLGTGFSNSRWQCVNFNGYLLMFNGTDAPQSYDGSTLGSAGWSGAGLTPGDLNGCAVYATRVIAWTGDDQDFWYGAVNAVTGTLTKFPLSRVGQFGGNLVAAAIMNVDSGEGVDDVIVFIMSSGDAIAYQGTDPGDAANWSLIGVYNIGRPIGARAIVQVGGDVLVTTTEDYVSVSRVLREEYTGGTSKLSGAVIDAAAVASNLFGWESTLHGPGGLIIFNVPLTNGNREQHVVNVKTKAACKFTNIKAHCWAPFGNDLYFGGDDGVVYKYTGADDNGADIQADGIQAWSDLGTVQTKNINAIRPLLKVEGDIGYEMGVGFDYTNIITTSPSSATTVGAEWDVAEWDVAEWGFDSEMLTEWRVSSGSGQAVTARLRVNTKSAVSWLRTDYLLEVGINL